MFVLKIQWVNMENLEGLERLLDFSINELKVLDERYVLIENSGDDNICYLGIHQILYDDFMANKFTKCYKNLKKVYGEEKLDLVILKDPNTIREKIKNILIFILDKLDTKDIKILFQEDGKNSIPSLIFDIVSKDLKLVKQSYDDSKFPCRDVELICERR